MAARTSSKKRSKAIGPVARKPIDRERLRAILTPVMRVVASLTVVVCLGILADHLAETARAHPRFLVDPSTIAEDAIPKWVPPPVAVGIRDRLAATPAVSIFDVNFTDRIRRAVIGASPWIETVARVDRIYPNRVSVEMALREPLVAIEEGDRRYLLDADGRLIHEESARHPSPFPFQVWTILGAQPDGIPQANAPYPDPRVHLAVAVARELRGAPEGLRPVIRDAGLVALQIPVGGKGVSPGEIFLRGAESNAVVRWGRPGTYTNDRGDALGILEKPVAQKMTHLAQIVEHFPMLRGIEEAQLYNDHPMFRPDGGNLQTIKSRYLRAESSSGS